MELQKDMVFFIDSYSESGNNDISKVAGKFARNYLNKFTINEDDQFEISNVHILDASRKRGPRRIDCMVESIKNSISTDLDVVLFGTYGAKGKPKGESSSEIRQICARLKNVNSNIENLRISFIDMDMRGAMHPMNSRIASENVNDFYVQTRRDWKLSLNEELEMFYEKCKSDGFRKNEFVSFFHAELMLLNEIQKCHEEIQRLETLNYHDKREHINKRLSKANKNNNASLQYTNLETENINKITQDFEAAIQASQRNEYRLYRGRRATLVFHPKLGLPNAEKLYKLSSSMTSMISRAYLHVRRRDVNAASISPTSTPDIDVFGFRKHKPSQKLRDSLSEASLRPAYRNSLRNFE